MTYLYTSGVAVRDLANLTNNQHSILCKLDYCTVSRYITILLLLFSYCLVISYNMIHIVLLVQENGGSFQ